MEKSCWLRSHSVIMATEPNENVSRTSTVQWSELSMNLQNAWSAATEIIGIEIGKEKRTAPDFSGSA
jgi:hypothetical protein